MFIETLETDSDLELEFETESESFSSTSLMSGDWFGLNKGECISLFESD